MDNHGISFFKYQIFVPTKAQRQPSSKPLVIYCLLLILVPVILILLVHTAEKSLSEDIQ